MQENTRLEKIEKQVKGMPSIQNEALEEIIKGLYQGKPLLGNQGLLTNLIKDLTQVALQGEMAAHLEENSLEEGGNRRNGISSKRVRSGSGSFDLEVPRDRNSSFEPQIIKKRQTVLNEELDNKILALYGLGTSYDDITAHLQEIYGVDVSASTIAAITDRLLPQITEWRNRPRESVYPILFLDAMFFKARQDGKVSTKVLYNVMGVTEFGHKDILGFYSCESEASHFWLSVLNDLKARGVKDILIACVDGLKGFPEAINACFPEAEVQLCVIHQIRNSLRYVASKNQKEFMADLKTVYKAETKDLAEYNLLRLDEKWSNKYPMVIKSWQQNWDEKYPVIFDIWQRNWSGIAPFFSFPEDIRKAIYTTNAIESTNRQIRKIIKNKGVFPDDKSIQKIIFLALTNASKKWTMPIKNWAMALNQFAILCDTNLQNWANGEIVLTQRI